MPYEVWAGRVRTWSLECHVVDHCNLRCENCCTLSPGLPSRFVTVERFAADVERARTALHPNLFKLTGGEPLLHPLLVELLEVARASGIADSVSVTTNGLLLHAVPDAFWDLVDRLTVSWYSSAPLPDAALERIEARCREHDVLLRLKRIHEFQRMDVEPDWSDDGHARAVHVRCWLRHRCHLIHEGRFYTCTRPPHLRESRRASGLSWPGDTDDGVSLDAPNLAAALRDYLQSDEPLASCHACWGGEGEWVDHAQESAAGR